MASTHALTDSMKNITKSMVALNKATNMPELSKIMQEFAKQSEQMEMKQEVGSHCKRMERASSNGIGCCVMSCDGPPSAVLTCPPLFAFALALALR
jgi:hypothetical protein